MGLEQSKIIKRQLLQPSRSASNSPEYQQREDRAKSASMKPQTPIPSMPRISPTKPTRPISSTGKLIPAARIDAVLAKVWNPNNPDSWDAPMREYHNADDSDYIMPSDEIEQTRLEAQHYIYRVGFQGDIICPAAKEIVKRFGTKVLDVGCAKAFWLKSIKRANPLPDYYGVDIADSVIAEASTIKGIDVKFGNVLDRLPYDDNTFDYVHQRLLVLGMPKEKYSESLKELIRVTKSGGWIELVEGDALAYNSGPYSRHLSKAMLDAMHARGLDCYAATNLEWHVWQVNGNISNQESKTVHIPLGGNTKLGAFSAENGKNGALALEDWMHRAMGISREEYRDLVQKCVSEWDQYNCFWQTRALYFQVKK